MVKLHSGFLFHTKIEIGENGGQTGRSFAETRMATGHIHSIFCLSGKGKFPIQLRNSQHHSLLVLAQPCCAEK